MKRLWIVPFGLVFAAMIWLVIATLPDIKRYMRMHEMYRRGNIQHTPVSAVRLTHSGRAGMEYEEIVAVVRQASGGIAARRQTAPCRPRCRRWPNGCRAGRPGTSCRNCQPN